MLILKIGKCKTFAMNQLPQKIVRHKIFGINQYSLTFYMQVTYFFHFLVYRYFNYIVKRSSKKEMNFKQRVYKEMTMAMMVYPHSPLTSPTFISLFSHFHISSLSLLSFASFIFLRVFQNINRFLPLLWGWNSAITLSRLSYL